MNNIMHIYFHIVGGVSSGCILRSGNAGSKANVLLGKQGPIPLHGVSRQHPQPLSVLLSFWIAANVMGEK